MKTADPSPLLRFFLLFLCLSLSVMSRDCHSCSAQRHAALPQAEELRKDRGDRRGRNGTGALGWDFLPFSVAVEFPLLKTKPCILSWSWERGSVTGAAPCLIPSPRCHFYCHSILQRNYKKDCGTFWEKKLFKVNEMG